MANTKSMKDIIRERYENRKSATTVPALNFRDANVNFWKPVEGTNSIHILPYIIKSKNHPLVKAGKAEIGDPDFVMPLYIHEYVGPNKVSIICPNRTFGKACPICEQAMLYRNEGKVEEAKKLYSRHKAYYNIVDNNDIDKGVQVFIASYALFHEELMEEIGALNAEVGDIVDFTDIRKGRLIQFRATKESFNRNEYFKYKSFKFLPREEPLNPDLLKHVYSFDEYLVIYSYDEIKKIFYEGEDDDDPDEEIIEIEKDESDDEEEIPIYEKEEVKKEASVVKCPAGGTLGKDLGKLDECDECELYGDCYEAYKEQKLASKK